MSFINKKQRLIKFIHSLPNKQIDRYTLGYWLKYEGHIPKTKILMDCKLENRFAPRSSEYKSIYVSGSTNLSETGYLMTDTGYGKLVRVKKGVYGITGYNVANPGAKMEGNCTAKFKVGDVVEIHTNSECGIPIGQTGTIVRILTKNNNHFDYCIKQKNNHMWWHSEEYLKLAIPKPKFKVGDQVKINEIGIISSNKKGDIGIITETAVSETPYTYRVTVEGRDNYANWESEDQLELYVEPKFKIGDIVEIKKRSYGGFPIGCICEIISIGGKDAIVKLRQDLTPARVLSNIEPPGYLHATCTQQHNYINDFIKIDKPKFKAGDVVENKKDLIDSTVSTILDKLEKREKTIISLEQQIKSLRSENKSLKRKLLIAQSDIISYESKLISLIKEVLKF